MKNFIQDGDTITVTAPEAVTSGRGLLVGTLFGVAVNDAATGDLVAIKTTGVFSHAKTSGQAWTVGAAVYWDNTAKVFTTAASGNTLVGKAVAAAANPSPVGTLRLNP